MGKSVAARSSHSIDLLAGRSNEYARSSWKQKRKNLVMSRPLWTLPASWRPRLLGDCLAYSVFIVFLHWKMHRENSEHADAHFIGGMSDSQNS